jgi:hypothetical protein
MRFRAISKPYFDRQEKEIRLFVVYQITPVTIAWCRLLTVLKSLSAAAARRNHIAFCFSAYADAPGEH